MRVVGVTGTNGKTTTTYLLDGIFRGAGWRPGVIGTTGVRIGDAVRPSEFTTPAAPELQACCATWWTPAWCVAIEVSSHALVQQRRPGTRVRRRGVHESLPRPPRLPTARFDRYLDAKLMLFDGRMHRTR